MQGTGETKEMKAIGRRLREVSRDLVEADLPDSLRALLQHLASVETSRCEKAR